MKKGYAEFSILRDEVTGNSRGYSVKICECACGGILVDEYSAGDSRHDSQVYGTGDISENELRGMAETTAREMLLENSLDGDVSETDE